MPTSARCPDWRRDSRNAWHVSKRRLLFSAGFTVGIIEKDALIDGRTLEPGDRLIALSSSGPHANGYSLIRHILKHVNADPAQTIGNTTLKQALLAPTRIYVKSVLALAETGLLKGAAHITGGGFIDNIPRILPEACAAQIDTASWTLPPVFAVTNAGQTE